jgi:hypothetical protein
MKPLRNAAAAFAALALLASASATAHASTFHAWEVAGVPWGDVLNVRKYPASTSQKQAAYPNGTVLQMTGRCTGGLNLDDVAGASYGQKKQAVRYRWCEVWHDPAQNGGFVTGWVYGKYITPY